MRSQKIGFSLVFACATAACSLLAHGAEALPAPGVVQQEQQQDRQRLEMEQEEYRRQLPDEIPLNEQRALERRMQGQRQAQDALQQRQQQEAAAARQREALIPRAGSDAARRGVFQQRQSTQQRQQDLQLRPNRSTWPRP